MNFKIIQNFISGKEITRDLHHYRNIIKRINDSEHSATQLNAEALLSNFQAYRNKSTFSDMDKAHLFSLVRESARRGIGMRAFDVQMIAGLAMLEGKIAQMQTGEGKTLAAIFSAAVKAISGKRVHIHTVNDYLARRDAQWMGPAYRAIGLSVGYIKEGMNIAQRQTAYASDIVYGTANEFGFDYLRDTLCLSAHDVVQGDRQCVLLDEIDSLLIDEARIPLVIAGEILNEKNDIRRETQLVNALIKGVDYESDVDCRNVFLTQTGIDKIERITNCTDLYGHHNISLLVNINLALHAKELLRRDVDYIVKNNTIELVDEFKGRIASKRRWPHGLQAALEAKEGLKITVEGKILSTITLEHFIKLYASICGMTATAESSAEELYKTYGLEVVIIPPNRPCIRNDRHDAVFTHSDVKEKALIEIIMAEHGRGRPLLVGTSSIKESEHLSAQLFKHGLTCNVLNAKNHEEEAHIIAEAGDIGAVTISTNMAGRGTDIRLGGSNGENRDLVVNLGGLLVIGTSRQESVRMDNQLRGRAGRQGDPGESVIYISLEDKIIQRYELNRLLPAKYLSDRVEGPIEDKKVNREIEWAQRIIDSRNAQIRLTLSKYSALMEMQRKIIHDWRHKILTDKFKSLLAERSSDKFQMVAGKFGNQLILNIERELSLGIIDLAWSDYVSNLYVLKEDILTNSKIYSNSYFSDQTIGNLLGHMGETPIHIYTNKAHQAFLEMQDDIETRIVAVFNHAVITEEGIDLKREGIIHPGSTWTYIINDESEGSVTYKIFKHAWDRLFRFIKC